MVTYVVMTRDIERLETPQTYSIRAKHQNMACFIPPTAPWIPAAVISMARPSRCRAHSLRDELIISSTQCRTQEAMIAVLMDGKSS